MGAVLAMDPGERVQGFAAADPLRIAVAPLPPLRVRSGGAELLQQVERLLVERDADTLLIGLPLDGDGRETGRSRRVRELAAALSGYLCPRIRGLRILGWNEHLSTQAARDLLTQEGLSKRRRQELRDSYAALVILRDWIQSGEPGDHPLAPGP